MSRQELLAERQANSTAIYELNKSAMSRKSGRFNKSERIKKDALRARNAEITKILSTLA